MGGWKSKFVFLLMVYVAGFATAIYCLVPAPETQPGEKSSASSAASREQFVQSFNVGMHKCLDVAKQISLEVSRLIKQKLDQRQANSRAEAQKHATKDY